MDVHVAGDGPLAEAARSAFSATGARLVPAGEGPLDVLVVVPGRAGAHVDAAMEVGFAAPVRLIREVLPSLAAATQAVIVVATTPAAREPAPGQAGDAAAQHALRGFLTTLRVELAARRRRVEACLVVGEDRDPARTAAALVEAAADPHAQVVVSGTRGARSWLTGVSRAVRGA